ncbi:MAG: tape measure protein, partial [Alphaproteobacteria bacterium]
MSNFAKKGERHGRQSGRGFAKGFSSGTSGMMKKLAAVIGVTAAGVAIGKQFVAAMKDAADRERFEVGVSALTGDADIGNEFFAHLREEAKRTGADIADLALTTRRMIGMGLSPDEAKKMTAAILDIQGSLALTNEEAKRLTVGLLQVKSKGVASMEELRQQIAEKGVPIFDALAKTFEFDSPDDLFKAISQGIVPAEAVLDVFTNLTGDFEKFRGGADKMAQTLGGAFNVMTAHFKDLRIEFAAPIADTIRPILRDIT